MYPKGPEDPHWVVLPPERICSLPERPPLRLLQLSSYLLQRCVRNSGGAAAKVETSSII